MSRYETIIVVPCFNEAKKFQSEEYSSFILTNADVLICLIDDGSTDNTLEVLNNLKSKYTSNIELVTYKDNIGKAEAVRKGINYCLENHEFEHIAYLDADLAVSLDECLSMRKYIKDEIVFCFGSRISKVGSYIDRKRSRFLIGRFIATLISKLLDIKVYDTQCGAKVFTKDIASKVFSDSFISKWLFDVEIFFRIIKIYGREQSLNVMLEVPLRRWVDRGDSKVKNSYFFKLFLDLMRIRKEYR